MTDEAEILAIERPDSKLMQYYFLCCLITGPLFFILIIPSYFRYYTMRYRFDHEGISMRWGILFRREVLLNYSRIQDIHLVSNLIERWLGLARIQIQTASGNATPEMTIEGLRQFETIRDFLYSRMRGMKERAAGRQATGSMQVPDASPATVGADAATELVQVLGAVAQELKSLRLAIEQGKRRLPPDA